MKGRRRRISMIWGALVWSNHRIRSRSLSGTWSFRPRLYCLSVFFSICQFWNVSHLTFITVHIFATLEICIYWYISLLTFVAFDIVTIDIRYFLILSLLTFVTFGICHFWHFAVRELLAHSHYIHNYLILFQNVGSRSFSRIPFKFVRFIVATFSWFPSFCLHEGLLKTAMFAV